MSEDLRKLGARGEDVIEDKQNTYIHSASILLAFLWNKVPKNSWEHCHADAEHLVSIESAEGVCNSYATYAWYFRWAVYFINKVHPLFGPHGLSLFPTRPRLTLTVEQELNPQSIAYNISEINFTLTRRRKRDFRVKVKHAYVSGVRNLKCGMTTPNGDTSKKWISSEMTPRIRFEVTAARSLTQAQRQCLTGTLPKVRHYGM